MNLQFDSANEYEEFIKAVRNGEADKAEDALTESPLTERTITVAQLAVICRHMHANEKIPAIKYIRTLLGYGLKESKELLEGIVPSE